MFTNLLFPVDFSGHCLSAVGYVSALAQKLESKITLLHALSVPGIPEMSGDQVSKEKWDDLERKCEQKLEVFGSPALNPFILRRLVRRGDPASVIAHYASGNSVDLIVMPTRGAGFSGAALGSVITGTLHKCAYPVWTMAHPEAYSPRSNAGIRTVLCTVDFGPDDKTVIRIARLIAGRWNSRICLVYPVPNPMMGVEEIITTDLLLSLEKTARDRMLALQQKLGISCESVALVGEAATVVREAAVESKSELVVTGRRQFQRTPGSSRSIIEKVPSPVLTV